MNRKLLPLAALALCAPASAGVRVELKPSVAPAGSVVTVGEAATLTPDSPADALAAQRLRSVPLAPAPAAGRSAVVTAAAVRTRAEAGGFRVTLAGADAVTLRSPRLAPAPVARPAGPSRRDRDWAESFAAAAVARALERSGAAPMHAELALHNDAVALLADRRPDACDVADLAPVPGVAQTVSLRWLDAADRVVAVPAALRLSPPRLVPVLTEPVPRGTPVAASQVAWEPAPHAAAADPAAAANAPTPADRFAPTGEATRDLPAGARLTDRDVRPTPLVRANQVVTVETSAGGVRVTRSLKAQRNGVLGETVPLTVPGSRDRLFARVVGNRRAVIVGDATGLTPYAAAPRPGDDR